MSAPDLPHGTLVGGDFRIVEAIARGGMGVVYVAEQESTRKRRALKVMLPQDGDLDTLRRRFEQEAYVSSQIESDHVVEVIGAGVDAATTMPWIAMELLEGEDLEQHLTSRGSLDWTDTWNIVGELCHALEAAHALGLVHRDLKPSNVFLAKSRRPGIERVVKVLDFGIAKRMSDVGKTTGALGTPLYMSPEQTTAGSTFSPATDVWALGLLVFEMLTGVPYWKSASQEGQIAALIRELVIDPLVPASARATAFGKADLLPPGFDAWFARCVVRDPKARFRHAGEAYRALAKLFGEVTGLSERVIPPASVRLAAAPPSRGARPGEVSPPSAPLEARTHRAFETGAPPVARSRTGLLVAGVATGVVVVALGTMFVLAPRLRPSAAAPSVDVPPARDPAAASSGASPGAPDVVPSPLPAPSAAAAPPPSATEAASSPSSSTSTSARPGPTSVPSNPSKGVPAPPAHPPPKPPSGPPSKPDPVII